MGKRVSIERKRLILDDFFKVEEAYLSYERFDGSMSPTVRRLNFERGDSVAAILVNKARNTVVLVNQFKYPAFDKGPGWITEVVAGMIAKDETPENALHREVLEETGFRIRNVEPIATFYVSPGGSSERIKLYYAEIVSTPKQEGGGLAEEQEDIKICEIKTKEILAQLERGEIVDAKTILGLMWLRRRLEQGAENG
jgi:nudix-type nucleoside diphosphatase (YffH/AdpP family)